MFSQRMIFSYLEKWSQIALRQRWVENWTEGAIFPREMVFFLAVCDANQVKNIVESGRQNGYSTEMIGYYAKENGGLAYSIDLESDRVVAEKCRERLLGNPKLVLLKGNALQLVGPLLMSDRVQRTAVLMDGPKGYTAISLLLAASGFSAVKVVALHNLHAELAETQEERNYFSRLSKGAHFYEDLGKSHGSQWNALEKEEVSVCTRVGALQASSLGVLETDALQRKLALFKMSRRFGRNQPLTFYLKWRIAG